MYDGLGLGVGARFGRQRYLAFLFYRYLAVAVGSINKYPSSGCGSLDFFG